MAQRKTKKKTKRKVTTKKQITADKIPVHCSHTRIAPIDSIVPNPANPNHHPPAQVDLLAKIIHGQGWRNPIVISKRSGFVVKGHCRLLAAEALSVKEVPVDEQDYESEAVEHSDLIADNRIAELAEMNAAELKDMLQELDTGELDMDLTGYIDGELEALMTEMPPDDLPPVDDPAANTNQITIEVPEESAALVKTWLSNGGQETAKGMGRGVMKRMEE